VHTLLHTVKYWMDSSPDAHEHPQGVFALRPEYKAAAKKWLLDRLEDYERWERTRPSKTPAPRSIRKRLDWLDSL
jgi:hypothetical protein